MLLLLLLPLLPLPLLAAMPCKAELVLEVEEARVEAEEAKEELRRWKEDMVGMTAARARQLERAHDEVRRLQAEVERAGRDQVAVDMELAEEKAGRKAEEAGRKEEEAKRQTAEGEVVRLQGELAAEKRRREDGRDLLLGVVKAMQEGTAEGRAKWEAWEKKARWGWHGEGKWG